MIIRSMEVAGWRCFVEPIAIGPFGDGLNVVHGANGVGKSSLFIALGRGLFDDHASGAESIKQLRPWGRELPPRVTIEFEHNGVTYRLHKQFLEGKKAELARLENGRYVPKAEGKSADQQARELLQAEAFGKRKAHDPQGWGLAQVLWAPQGEMAVGELSGPARQTLQQALGAQVVGSHVHALEEKVTELDSSAFTAGGKYKSGASAPRIVGLEQQLSDAETSAARHREKLAAFDDASRRIEDLHAEALAAREELKGLEASLVKVKARVETYQQSLGACEFSRKAAEAAQATFKQRDDKVRSVQSARKKLREKQEQLAAVEREGPALAQAVELQQHELDQASATVESVRQLRSEVGAARRLAGLARTITDARRSLASLDSDISRFQAVDGELDRLRAKRRAILAPDSKQLAAIHKAARERDDARLRLDSSLITLEIRGESDIDIEVLKGESPGRQAIGAGTTATFQGAPEVAIRLSRLGTIRATGPTGSVEAWRRQVEDAIERLGQLTRGFGTQDAAELERRTNAARDIDNEIAQAQTRRETILSGRDGSALLGERALLAQQVNEVLASQPDWNEASPDPVALADEAERIEREFTGRIDAAEDRSKSARTALSLAAQNLVRYEERQKHAKSELSAAEEVLGRLTADGLSDEDRQQQLDEAAMQWRAAKKELESLEKKLAEFGSDPRPEQAVLESQVQAVRQKGADANKNLHTAEGNLQHIVAEAPYSALAADEERMARMQDEIARERLRLDAIRLLHETLARRKREIVESLVGPVCKRAEQTLGRIAGSRFERLAMNENFELNGIVPRNADGPVSLDQLSGGEREQVYFAVRLALADIAFGGQRQLVVLDDVFTFTDTARLARIVSILQEAAERFQIVLLTCHPERYRGLPSAKFFDLEEIVSTRSFAR